MYDTGVGSGAISPILTVHGIPGEFRVTVVDDVPLDARLSDPQLIDSSRSVPDCQDAEAVTVPFDVGTGTKVMMLSG
ncbi:MAG: hypothetical protein ACRDVW_02795 [Acidimicrobiales bacterium]